MYRKTDTSRTCKACHTEQSIEEFIVRAKGYPISKQRTCRKCRAKKLKEDRKKPNPILVEQKECKVCCQTKPASEFAPNANSKDGLYHQCRECRRKAHRRYNDELLSDPRRREAHREQSRDWKRNNRDKMLEYQRKWESDNPRYHSVRNSHLRNGDLTRDQWEMVLAYFDYRCAYCRSDQTLEIEHIVPISKGGKHTLKNVVPSCRKCNRKKYNRTPEEVGMTFIKPLPNWDQYFLADKEACLRKTRQWIEEAR